MRRMIREGDGGDEGRRVIRGEDKYVRMSLMIKRGMKEGDKVAKEREKS